MEKIERKALGEEYFFIDKDYKHFRTHDWYFDTDNEKYEGDNYFYTVEAARACSGEIQERWGDELDKLKRQDALNRTKFITDISAGLDNVDREVTKKQREEQDMDPLLFDLLSTYQRFRNKRDEISSKRKSVTRQIDAFIKKAPKI